MNRLTDPYYDAIVISDEVDPNHGGAVRIKVFGVTEDLDDKDQPFAIPSVNSQQAVPTKGTLLRVTFEEGDINQPKYIQTSPEKTYLPEEFTADYPNVAVSNLGDDFFIMTHNRRTKDTNITHPSESVITWDAFGTITHDSDKGYKNAGYGASSNRGQKIHPVLTEATIDVFCCTPVGNNTGNGGANQGSEYLKVTHISNSTVERINGGSNSDFSTSSNPVIDDGENEEATRDINDINGALVRTVEFVPTKSIVERNSPDVKDDIKGIIIGITGSNNFIDIANRIKDETNNFSAHYLIGRQAGSPPIDSARTATDEEKARGFLQFVELNNDATYGSESALSLKSYPTRANTDTVSILLVSDGKSFTEFQYTTLNQVIDHVKSTFDDKSVEIYKSGDLGEFDKSKIGFGILSWPSTLVPVKDIGVAK